MSKVPDELKYTKNDEWARIEGNRATVGITDWAQEQLTDIVFIELPKVGKQVKAGEELAVVESVKHTAQVFSPISGKVVKVHEEFEADPDNLKAMNNDPYGEGWIAVIETTGTNPELLSAADYKAAIASKGH